MALDAEKIPFGLADVTIGEDTDAIHFDGKEEFQFEGGELTFTPILQDITVADFGESVFDQRVTGYEGSLSLSGAQETLQNLKLAMSYMEEITDATTSEVTGLMDGKIGTSMRSKAQKITIHPRIMGTDTSLDIVVYKMASNGEYTRSYANEQGSIPMQFTMYPRDGLDVSKPGNFFYVGGTDPNAPAA
ncbi:hypothetical protein [Halobacillus naozhouensis]|uniref:Uncharacterized protein n=1 Tax=Halobacillus naozhouensis TaxID=554880 RepID=A0ABY8J161_9BACI|nr:hypothetical protein [Halobacillus naozhouensis]WFT76244.1 hypothetical protein P9989_07740 [Halobacillus naozhouensis]